MKNTFTTAEAFAKVAKEFQKSHKNPRLFGLRTMCPYEGTGSFDNWVGLLVHIEYVLYGADMDTTYVETEYDVAYVDGKLTATERK